MPFQFKRLEIEEVILITPRIFEDNRGFFAETFKKSDFEDYGIITEFVQDNHSKSSKDVIRGIHYQKIPSEQGKLVRAINGSLFDVAVDLRNGSPTFGKWVGRTLSAINMQMLWVPPGFGHGIAILEDDTELLYKVTNEYSPNNERIIRWNDPELAINWPIDDPILSEKDANAPLLKDADINFGFDVSS